MQHMEAIAVLSMMVPCDQIFLILLKIRNEVTADVRRAKAIDSFVKKLILPNPLLRIWKVLDPK